MLHCRTEYYLNARNVQNLERLFIALNTRINSDIVGGPCSVITSLMATTGDPRGSQRVNNLSFHIMPLNLYK